MKNEIFRRVDGAVLVYQKPAKTGSKVEIHYANIGGHALCLGLASLFVTKSVSTIQGIPNGDDDED